ncbi:hypothetical protein [Candidatus Uabimicrobium sp. HlEnr_7]|uniref:hypothetical protein n=1 Tax=Candidatus Uabimicrobium helgolandensis TaxID=3095367 RepID=UPI0035569B57
MYKYTLLAVVSFSFIFVGAVDIKFKTQRVIVFKDGYCLVVKKGSATSNDKGEIISYDVPQSAVLGSLWATAKEADITSLNAEWREVTKTEEKDFTCTEYVEILEVNKGKKCKIVMNDKTKYEGRIHRVLLSKSVSNLSQNVFNTQNSQATISSISGSYFVLRTETGDMLLPVSQIRSLFVRNMITTIKRKIETKERRKQLTFHFAQANKKHNITLMYFTPGMRWIPSYRIDLQPKNIAAISLQAEIINENEDLLDVPMDIVVGVPNFRFRDTVSPLSLENTLRNVLRNSQRQNRTNSFSNAAVSLQQINAYSAPQRSQQSGNVTLPSELTAKGSQDLFVYKLPKLTIRKGGRAAVHIFTAKVKYRDIYTWKAAIKHNLSYSSKNRTQLEFSENKIWHEIELLNNTELPWTTGAAMIMQGQQPLAQELLTYTSSGSKVRVPVTIAVDIQGTVNEKETKRQPRDLKWDGYHYVKVNNQAKLDVCNNKRGAIDIEIIFAFGGKATQASDDGNVTLHAYNSRDWNNYRGSSAVNNSTTVKWKKTIKAGESFMPQVDYFYYIRH